MAEPSFTRDPCIDPLLALDGEVFVIDPEDRHWVKFEVKQVEASPERPHGLKYSLTLHDGEGERLVGFDNAHAVKGGTGPGALTRVAQDHRHRLRTIRPYDYRNAGDLLADFWKEVEAVLAERGVKL